MRRRIMTLFLPLLFATWLAAGVSWVATAKDSTAGTILFWVVMPFAVFLLIPVAGFLVGLIGYEPRPMRQLDGVGWSRGMRIVGRQGRWHHT